MTGILRLRTAVLIADNELRLCVVHCLSELPQVEVCWQGGQLAELPRSLGADLVLLGVEGADVVPVTGKLAQDYHLAVLLVAPVAQHQPAWIFEAMGRGALDVVQLHPAERRLRTQNRQMLHDKVGHLVRLLGKPVRKLVTRPEPALTRRHTLPLVAIGASTGGPAAVVGLLRTMPQAQAAAWVLIQHLDVEFADSLSQWLGQNLNFPVKRVQEGQALTPGVLWVAATQDHLILTAEGFLHYTPDPRSYPYRPSVDVFFQSVAEHWRGAAAGVLLTGMGRDGAQGLLALRQRGFMTLAQNQASCVIYGMPKAAVELGAVSRLGDLVQLNASLQQWLTEMTPTIPMASENLRS